jgi:putative FmdB family regulatory protein
MPLFGYVCEKCDKRSEILIRGAETPVCPYCGSDRLVKQASAFAPMGASGAPSIPPGCESCCSRRDGTCPRI